MSTPGMTSDIDRGRNHLVRRGRRLAWFTIGWNLVEGVSAIAAGVMAGSIVLIGFGVDSYIEVFAGGVVLWRLAKEKHGEEISATAEGRALRLIAVTFFVLAVGIGTESVRRLITGARPAESLFGIVIAALSVIAMPLLAGAKRRVGEQLGSRALVADAGETMFCAWLSVILLAGLGLNAVFGWVGRPDRRFGHCLFRVQRGRGELAGRRARGLTNVEGPGPSTIPAKDDRKLAGDQPEKASTSTAPVFPPLDVSTR